MIRGRNIGFLLVNSRLDDMRVQLRAKPNRIEYGFSVIP